MRAIFLDRDGVINQNRPDHVKRWSEFQFIPGSLTALRMLTRAGYRIYIITNQAAVSRGLLPPAELDMIHARMTAIAEQHGARISGLRYCPHAPEERCACRKPRPGMLQSLAAEHSIDCSRAYLVGDALTDIAAGQAVGCRSILVTTGRGAEEIRSPEIKQLRPDHVADNLLAATCWLIVDAESRRRPQPLTPAVAHGAPAL